MLSCTVPRTAHNHYKLLRPLGLTSTPLPGTQTRSVIGGPTPFKHPRLEAIHFCCHTTLYSTRVSVKGVVWWCYDCDICFGLFSGIFGIHQGGGELAATVFIPFLRGIVHMNYL